jgi:type IX secretion system PorP/SprF family membrane protein
MKHGLKSEGFIEMKKRIAFLLLIVLQFEVLTSTAQQLPLYSQYRWNDYIINPAFTGASDVSPIQLSYRKQWIGFNGSPETITLGGHTAINKSMGVGGMIFKDATGGAFSQTGILLNYAYRISLNRKSTLSFGISTQLNQYCFNTNEINALNPNDLALQSGRQTGYVADVSFGLLYQYKKQLKVGVAVNQLLQSKLRKLNANQFNQNQLVAHYNLMFFYTLKLNELFELKPSMLLKATAVTPLQLDIGSQLEYKKRIWFGLSYRPKDAVVVMLGIRHNSFVVSYSYDVTLSAIRSNVIGSGELMVGYRISPKKKDWSLL